MNLLVVEDNPRDMQELLNLLHGWEEQNPTRITTPTRWAMIIKKSPLKTPRFTKEREPGLSKGPRNYQEGQRKNQEWSRVARSTPFRSLQSQFRESPVLSVRRNKKILRYYLEFPR